MAIELSTKENTMDPNGEFPYGNIIDDDGSGTTGTPVNVQVYADFHQFFARMFAQSGLSYNGVPENAYDGFQYFEALMFLIQRNGLAQFVFDNGAPPGGVITGIGYYVDLDTGDIYEAVNSTYSQIMFGWLPSAWVNIGGGGGAPAFQNSWDNVSIATPARYRKTPGGLVTLDGVINDGASGSVAFTLPTGFRPSHQTILPAFGSVSGGVASYVEVNTNGTVVPNITGGGTAVLMSLNGSFYTS